MSTRRTRLPWREVVDRYLIPYREEHGNILVHSGYLTPDGYKLGQWIKEKRKHHAKGTLPAEQVRLLEELGMVWSARGLDTWADVARDYRNRNGNLDVPQDYVADDGTPLGRYINGARTSRRLGVLRPETREFLDSLDPAWAAAERTKADASCSVQGCASPEAGRGWCRKHYNNWYNHGSPTP